MIYGVDMVEIHVMDEIVLDIFNSKNCPAMINKPKIFISNACRGEKELLGIKVKVMLFLHALFINLRMIVISNYSSHT